MYGTTYEERSFNAENRVVKLERLLLTCKKEMTADVEHDWSPIIEAIDSALEPLKE